MVPCLLYHRGQRKFSTGCTDFSTVFSHVSPDFHNVYQIFTVDNFLTGARMFLFADKPQSFGDAARGGEEHSSVIFPECPARGLTEGRESSSRLPGEGLSEAMQKHSRVLSGIPRYFASVDHAAISRRRTRHHSDPRGYQTAAHKPKLGATPASLKRRRVNHGFAERQTRFLLECAVGEEHRGSRPRSRATRLCGKDKNQRGEHPRCQQRDCLPARRSVLRTTASCHEAQSDPSVMAFGQMCHDQGSSSHSLNHSQER